MSVKVNKMRSSLSVKEIIQDGPETCLEREFRTVHYAKRVPLVLKGLDIGPCRQLWSWDYLAEKCCSASEIKVHVSPTPQMDFINKNFAYKTLPWKDFIHRVQTEDQTTPFYSKSEKYYLRSIGENPRKQVADVRREFPEIATDVRFPSLYDEDCFFSSVFRIASRGLQLWTHYDVMDNMLIVVTGVKRVVLYDPADAGYLYLRGDKSQVLDIDNPDENMFPEFHRATRHECTLYPGDVLFIPALWFHNVSNDECGVAVNVFWRHLAATEYDGTDTYGNKDHSVAARADTVLDRALKLLDTLPDEYRQFYARRMISKIQTKFNV